MINTLLPAAAVLSLAVNVWLFWRLRRTQQDAFTALDLFRESQRDIGALRNQRADRLDHLLRAVDQFAQERDRWRDWYYDQGRQHYNAQALLEAQVTQTCGWLARIVQRYNEAVPDKPIQNPAALAPLPDQHAKFLDHLLKTARKEAAIALQKQRDEDLLLSWDVLLELHAERRPADEDEPVSGPVT